MVLGTAVLLGDTVVVAAMVAAVDAADLGVGSAAVVLGQLKFRRKDPAETIESPPGNKICPPELGGTVLILNSFL